MLKLETLSGQDSVAIRGVKEVQKRSFPSDWIEGESTRALRCVLLGGGGINLVAKEADRVVGYIISQPLYLIWQELCSLDRGIGAVSEINMASLYIRQMAIDPDSRSLAVLTQLIDGFLEKAWATKNKRLYSHARVSTKFSNVLQRRYSFQFHHRVEDWSTTKEAFDYIYYDLKPT